MTRPELIDALAAGFSALVRDDGGTPIRPRKEAGRSATHGQP